MRYSSEEKLEIIRLVESSHAGVKRTLTPDKVRWKSGGLPVFEYAPGFLYTDFGL